MHHVVLDRWSRGSSPLHRRDPRAKIVALLVFLVALATAHRALPELAAALFAAAAARPLSGARASAGWRRSPARPWCFRSPRFSRRCAGWRAIRRAAWPWR